MTPGGEQPAAPIGGGYVWVWSPYYGWVMVPISGLPPAPGEPKPPGEPGAPEAPSAPAR